MDSELKGKYSVSVLLSCSELKNEWLINSQDKEKVLKIVNKIKEGKLSDKTKNTDALYKGFWVNFTDNKIHIFENEVTVYSKGIITFKCDNTKKLQSYIYNTAPKGFLARYIQMIIESKHEKYSNPDIINKLFNN
jgi:hypothetical protein